MHWKPFYNKIDDNEDNVPSEKNEDGSEKVTDLNEVTVTAPKKEAPAGDDGFDFTVSEDQLGKPFKESPDFEVKEGMHNKIYDTQPSDTPATPAASTPAAAPAAELAGTTAGADRVPDLPVEALGKYHQQQEEEEEYLKAHPWVAESDLSVLYDKYKDKTPAQMIYDISQYRNKHGQRLNEEELALLLAGRDPNRSKKEVTKEKRRAYWADMINEIGNVLAHFYNYGRAKAGSPAATITPNKSDNVARLRAADMAMRQRGYNDYVNAMASAEKRRQAREDELRKLKQQQSIEQMRHANRIELEKLKWLSPEYKKKVEAADIDLRNKDTQHDILELEKAFKMLRNETAKNNAVDFFIKKNKGNGSGGGNNLNKTQFVYTYKIGDLTYTETDEYKAYKRAMEANHPDKRLKKPGKVTRQDLIDAGVTFPGSETNKKNKKT